MAHSDHSSPSEGHRDLRHQHSASTDLSSRALVPMWDSSDPERAPPPLPLNPQSPSLTSRAGTSSAIQSAHAALNERARESNALVPAFAKRARDESQDRSFSKGSHRRTQTLQPGSVRDLSLILEGTNSPSASPTKSSFERYSERSSTSTPTPRQKDRESSDANKEKENISETSSEANSAGPMPGPSWTPIVRPSARRPPTQSILGENAAPQSSTMLALQSHGSQISRADSEPPLSNVTNGASGLAKPLAIDTLSSQILSLTSIATALQKEMSALSRRSRDNATDLLSLKEATNTRDEDIRKSLRDLVGSVNETSNRLSSGTNYTGLFLDSKPFNGASPNSRGIQLPRIPSPKSFSESIDRSSTTPSLPSLVGGDGAALGLLEKIIKDMGTKEGQDTLISRLTEVSSTLAGMATASKVDELVDHIRQSESAVVATSRDLAQSDVARGSPVNSRVDAVLRNESRRSSAPARGAEIINEDLIKIIRSVKDSVAQGGGLTAEVKALVRELRGEVLGMGRELGKRLEQVDHKSIQDSEHPSKDEVSRVIDEGLEQMKDQLNHVLREHRRQSAQSAVTSKSLVDYQEIYNAMRAALRDNEASRGEMPDLSRDDVIEAVRDAWETYKPEIEVQQLGLERDEVLAVLKEGIQEYAPRDEAPTGATREEVFKAVVEGFKHFVPPQMDTSASMSRDEIIEAVRDCLEEFEFPVAASAIGNEQNFSHEDMVHAVKEGLDDMEIPRGGAMMSSGDNSEMISRLEDLMGYIKLEFRAVSQEAKDNVAANGRDTEQVLDATKDGLENLRIAIEGYVDRVSGEAGQEDFMQGLLETLDSFKEDLSALVTQSTEDSRGHLQTELESIREIVNSSMVPAMPQQQPGNNSEVLEALQTAANNLRQEILRPKAETAELMDALNDGFNDLRAGLDRVTNKPVDLTANDEIMDAINSVKSEVETIREKSSEQALAAVSTSREAGADQAIIPADMVKQDDIKNLEVLITQLRIKVEAMEPETDNVHKADLAHLEEMLQNVQQGIEEIGSREVPTAARDATATDATPSGDAATKDDVEAIETILRNTKSRLDDLMDNDQAIRKEHLDVIETLILETRESMGTMTEQMEAVSRKDDLTTLETLITQIKTDFDEVKSEMKEKTEKDGEEDAEKVSKTDVEAVETVVLEIKDILNVFQGFDFNTLPQKEDLTNLEAIVKEAKEKLESMDETAASAVSKKDEDMTGVGERVTEVKTFLEEFQETLKSKLDDGSTGIEALGKLLETVGEKMDKNENVGADLKEMFETMKTEFEDSRGVVAGAKLESDEKLQQATESIGTKIDDKITELITKYDEFQASFDEKQTAGEARSLETEEAVVGTKAVADELKLLVDTLGSTVTDSLEKMEEASKTVFEKVDELVSRSDETQAGEKAEHQQTRDQLHDAVSMVESLRGEVSESHPKILEAIQEVLALVGQHYEHSKTSTTELQDKFVEAKPTEESMQALGLLTAPEKYDDSEVHSKLDKLADIKYDDTELREKLDQLGDVKYDDSAINEKLDRLVTHTDAADQAFSQLANLDKVHESVVKTAADITEFLESHKQRIENEHEDREKTLHETALSLERKRAEKDHVEASVLSLKDEEERLRDSITSLRTEQESLIRQKTRLTGDVSSLEMAMRLRKEELSEMESRAERLERRIVDGVMDHSRVLLMSKASKNADRDSMNRKRVKKPLADDTPSAKPSPKPVMNMALSGKRSLAPPGQTGAARRIASLGQINNNVSSGGMKRSQSVRTPVGKTIRKSSWAGGMNRSETDKENLSVKETVEEVDEGDTPTVIVDGASEVSPADVDDAASEYAESVVSSSLPATDGGVVGMNGGDVVVFEE